MILIRNSYYCRMETHTVRDKVVQEQYVTNWRNVEKIQPTLQRILAITVVNRNSVLNFLDDTTNSTIKVELSSFTINRYEILERPSCSPTQFI